MSQSKKSGSVYRNKAGRWVASVTDPTPGKRKVKYATLEAEGRKKLQELKRRLLWKSLLRKRES
jgi:hypothetical protein